MQVISQNNENNRQKNACACLPKKFKSSIKCMQVIDQKMLVIGKKDMSSTHQKNESQRPKICKSLAKIMEIIEQETQVTYH